MSRGVAETDDDPALDALVRKTNRTLGLVVLGFVAVVVALLTVVDAASVVNDVRHFAGADECDVATYVEAHGPSDPIPDQVRFVDRRWVPPEVHCEVRIRTDSATFEVVYSYWYALAALVPLLCLLGLSAWGISRLINPRTRVSHDR